MPDVRIDQAARLAHEWASLGSIELTAVKKNPPLPGMPQTLEQICRLETHYIETPAHQRFADMAMASATGSPIGRRAVYSDGKRHSTFEYGKNDPSVPEKMSFTTSFGNEAEFGGSTRPIPLCYYFIDKAPLHEVLPGSTYLGVEPVAGKPHHTFLFPNLTWGRIRQDLVLHLAEDSILPTKLTFYTAGADRVAAKPRWSWTATTIETIQGRNFPVKSRLDDYFADYRSLDGSKPPAWAAEITVEKVEFGKSYPATTFWHENDERALLIDKVAGRIVAPKVRPAATKAVVTDPVRVAPVADDSSYLMSGGVTIGVVALVSGLILRIRRGS